MGDRARVQTTFLSRFLCYFTIMATPLSALFAIVGINRGRWFWVAWNLVDVLLGLLAIRYRWWRLFEREAALMSGADNNDGED